MATERLRLTNRSVVVAVVLLAATLVVLRVLAASGRIIGWVLVAASLAGLVYPAVDGLGRKIPRGLAVLAVAFSALAGVGLVTYGIVEDVTQQLETLQEAAPARAQEIERSERFGETARSIDLAERTERFVEEVPDRLRGGTPAEAIRSAATRGLAFLAVFVLTLFFVLHGPRIATAAAHQIHDDDRRALARRLARAAYDRGFGYARGSIAMGVAAGVFGYLVARLAEVPGPAPLAVWLALWDMVPLLGALIGALPIVVLAVVGEPVRGLVVGVAFVAWQLAEYLVLQRPLERSTVRVGPFVTVAAGMLGLELYGISGALLAVLVAALAMAALVELADDAG